jgi:hypothetical protein
LRLRAHTNENRLSFHGLEYFSAQSTLLGTSADALGKRIRVATTDDWREIIGVVGNVFDNGVSRPSPTTIFWPVLMDRFEGQKEHVARDVAFAIRTSRAARKAS